MLDDFPKYLHLAKYEEVVITKDRKPAGVLIGFRSDDDWLEFQLEQDRGLGIKVESTAGAVAVGQAHLFLALSVASASIS